MKQASKRTARKSTRKSFTKGKTKSRNEGLDNIRVTVVDADGEMFKVAFPPNDIGLVDNGAPKVASITGGLRQANPVEHGRYDLIPPDCLRTICRGNLVGIRQVHDCLLEYLDTHDESSLASALLSYAEGAGGINAMTHRLAVHYARGSVKYTARNWEKGIETGRCVDSMLAHEVKFTRGDTDEDHLAALLWNGIALMWTVRRIQEGKLPKELDTYGLAA